MTKLSGKSIRIGGLFIPEPASFRVTPAEYVPAAKAILAGDNVLSSDGQFKLEFSNEQAREDARAGKFPTGKYVYLSVLPHLSPDRYSEISLFSEPRVKSPGPTL